MSDWKGVIAAVAPSIATLLGAPAFVPLAIRTIAGAIGIDEKASEQEVAAAVTGAGPEVIARIREADTALKSKFMDVGLRLEELAQSDRAGARQREMALGKADNFQRSLAVWAIASLMALLGALFFIDVPAGVREMVSLILGTLLGTYKDVFAYYFGTSKGSTDKMAVIDRLVNPRDKLGP